VLSVPRNLASVTTLDNGKVLIAGGTDGKVYHNTMELFDPATGTIKLVGAKLSEGRALHTATMLKDGRVAIVGGGCASGCVVKTAELYDPGKDQVTSLGSPAANTYYHQTTLLADGRLLVTGGAINPEAVKLFDPKILSWSQTVAMGQGRNLHTATLVGDKVIVTGGESSAGQIATVEIYTP